VTRTFENRLQLPTVFLLMGESTLTLGVFRKNVLD